MEDILMEIVKDGVDEKISTAVSAAVSTAVDAERQETKVLDISNLMINLKLTVEQAMDALSIPTAQREIYAGLVKGNK